MQTDVPCSFDGRNGGGEEDGQTDRSDSRSVNGGSLQQDTLEDEIPF